MHSERSSGHCADSWQSRSRSDGHDAGQQPDDATCIPHEPECGSPQQACPDSHSLDTRHFRPSVQEWCVSSHVPSSRHLEKYESPSEQTSSPGQSHGTPLSGTGQLRCGYEPRRCETSFESAAPPLLQPTAATNITMHNFRQTSTTNPP